MSDNDKNTSSIVPVQPNEERLDENIHQLTQQLIDETSIDSSKDLVQLFNFNMSKKNALRILKLSGLYDQITDQMIDRFQRRSGEFSNSDLLSYLQTVENSMEKSQKTLSQIDSQPPIQVQNNTQVNFNVLDTFDNDSKVRIADAIKAFLSSASSEDTNSSNEDIGVEFRDVSSKEEKEDL